MSKGLIAVDIDDTLTESRNGLRKAVNEKLDIDLPIEAYSMPGDYWGYYERVWAEHGIKAEFSELEIYEELHTDQSRTPLLPGAEFAIHELLKTYDIVLITSRDAKWETHTKEWLEENFPAHVPELYFCRSHRDAESQTKGQIAKGLGAAWLIDDNVDHCKSALDEGLQAILFGKYGWHHDKPEDLMNLPDWPAVLEYFQSL